MKVHELHKSTFETKTQQKPDYISITGSEAAVKFRPQACGMMYAGKEKSEAWETVSRQKSGQHRSRSEWVPKSSRLVTLQAAAMLLRPFSHLLKKMGYIPQIPGKPIGDPP